MAFDVNVPNSVPGVYVPSWNHPFQLTVFPMIEPPEHTVYFPPAAMSAEEKKTAILLIVLGILYISIALPSESEMIFGLGVYSVVYHRPLAA